MCIHQVLAKHQYREVKMCVEIDGENSIAKAESESPRIYPCIPASGYMYSFS
jgi:hypothetical protein